MSLREREEVRPVRRVNARVNFCANCAVGRPSAPPFGRANTSQIFFRSAIRHDRALGGIFRRSILPMDVRGRKPIPTRHVLEAMHHLTRLSREARWRRPSKPDAKSRCSTKCENVDAQFCISDSFAAACAIAHQKNVSSMRRSFWSKVVDRKLEQQSGRKRHENHGDCGLPELCKLYRSL